MQKKPFNSFFCKCFKVFFSKKNISNGFTTDSRSKRVQVAVKDTKRTSPRFCIKKTEKLILMRFSKEGVFGLFQVCIFFSSDLCVFAITGKSNCSNCLQRNLDLIFLKNMTSKCIQV
jgi:hypothetical protein